MANIEKLTRLIISWHIYQNLLKTKCRALTGSPGGPCGPGSPFNPDSPTGPITPASPFGP